MSIEIQKFGRCGASLSTTRQTMWNKGGRKTYASSVFRPTMKSDGADTTQNIQITGIRVINGVWTYASETSVNTVNGANAVQFANADWIRIFRARSINDDTDFAGTLNIYRDAVEANTEIQIAAGLNQSVFCGVTIPDNYEGELYDWGGSSTTTKALIRRWVKDEGGVFRLQGELDNLYYNPKPYPPGCRPKYSARQDLEMTAELESGSGGFAIGDFNIVLNYKYAA